MGLPRKKKNKCDIRPEGTLFPVRAQACCCENTCTSASVGEAGGSFLPGLKVLETEISPVTFFGTVFLSVHIMCLVPLGVRTTVDGFPEILTDCC